MCSRYNLISSPKVVRDYFSYETEAEFPPRYNIAPSQPVAIVRRNARGVRELALVLWGLIPGWVKDPRAFKRLINARAETAAEKPSFRGPIRHRRCLVPADGYYEWTGPARARRPHLVRLKSGGPMAIAGIFESWLGADGSEIETMAILTVPANAALAHLHPRMPAILPPEVFEQWLDCRSGTAEEVLKLLVPAPDDLLEVVEVSDRVNDPRNEGPELQQPVHTTLF